MQFLTTAFFAAALVSCATVQPKSTKSFIMNCPGKCAVSANLIEKIQSCMCDSPDDYTCPGECALQSTPTLTTCICPL